MKTLTTKTEEVALYIRLEKANIRPELFAADMKRVEEEYIIPVIGENEYAALLSAYEASIAAPPTSLPSEDAALLNAIRWASVPLCFYSVAPTLFQSITSGGIMVKSNTDQGQMSTTKWGYKEFRIDCLKKGMNSIDKLYEFLDKSTPGTYAAWEASENYTQFKNNFIQTTAQFNNCYYISNNRNTFLKLKHIMQDVEQEYILPTISNELFAALKTKLVNNTGLSSYEKALLEKIRKTIAYYSIALGLEQIVFVQTGNSIVAQSSVTTDEYSAEVGGNVISDTAIERMKLDANQKALSYLAATEKYLNDNASQFSAYANSELYTAKQNQPRIEVNHRDSKTFFFFN
jgi:hypothetical protein